MWFTQSECDRQRRLLLEYNASGQTISIVEWEHVETNAFSNEADWYIDAIASIHWNSVHFAIYAVDGVTGFTNSHNDLGVTVEVNGYSAIILIPDNFGVKSFHQCTNRNHSSPSIVDVWSSIASKYVVVHNIFGGVDGHNNSAVSEWIFSAKGVVQSCWIYFGASLNNNYDISSSFFIRVNSDGAFTARDATNFYRNLSIFVALVSDPSFDGTLHLLNFTVFVNDRYRNFVVLSDRALFGTEFEGLIGVGLHNSQCLGYELLVSSVVSNNFDFSTDQRIVYWGIYRSYESTIFNVDVTSCFTIETIVYRWSVNLDAVFVNINCINSYELTKGNLIINSYTGFIRVARIFAIVMSVDVENSILNLAELSNIEGYSCIVTARKSNTNFVLTRNEIFCIGVTTYISEGVNAIVCIPNKVEVARFELRVIIALSSQFELVTLDSIVTSYRIFFLIIPELFCARLFCCGVAPRASAMSPIAARSCSSSSAFILSSVSLLISMTEYLSSGHRKNRFSGTEFSD